MPLKQRSKRVVAISVGALGLCLALGGLLWSVSGVRVAVKEDHTQALKLYKNLGIGLTSNQVKKRIVASGHFKVFQRKNQMWAQSPVIWGSLNWFVVTEIQNDRVVQFGIRESDNPNRTPAGAPPDLVISIMK